MASGVRLGWLINPKDQQVEIYRPGQGGEVRSLPTQLSGESVLPGFILEVSPLPSSGGYCYSTADLYNIGGRNPVSDRRHSSHNPWSPLTLSQSVLKMP